MNAVQNMLFFFCFPPCLGLLLIPCCSLLFVYNSVLFIVEWLKWCVHVRCEHQYVSDLGMLLLPQLVFSVFTPCPWICLFRKSVNISRYPTTKCCYCSVENTKTVAAPLCLIPQCTWAPIFMAH